jgi:hypothetical protein
MKKPCFACYWMKPLSLTSENRLTKYFQTCSLEMFEHGPVIFCEVERLQDTGCGKEGRYFRAVDRGEDIDLRDAKVTWVQRVGRGIKPG